MDISKDKLIKRPDGMAIDLPWELGYKCPICKKAGENLTWSEYLGFLWCYDCKEDIPSCLATEPIKNQIEIFIQVLNSYKKDTSK